MVLLAVEFLGLIQLNVHGLQLLLHREQTLIFTELARRAIAPRSLDHGNVHKFLYLLLQEQAVCFTELAPRATAAPCRACHKAQEHNAEASKEAAGHHRHGRQQQDEWLIGRLQTASMIAAMLQGQKQNNVTGQAVHQKIRSFLTRRILGGGSTHTTPTRWPLVPMPHMPTPNTRTQHNHHAECSGNLEAENGSRDVKAPGSRNRPEP